MKTVLLILVVIFSSPVLMAQDAGFILVQDSTQNPFDRDLLKAKKMALSSISRFMQDPVSGYSSEPQIKTVLDGMYSGLEQTTLQRLNLNYGGPRSFCTSSNIGLSIPFPFNFVMNICSLGYKLDLNQLYQSMIHEAYHIASRLKGDPPNSAGHDQYIKNEGTAVIYEFSIMNTQHKCLFLESGYWQKDADVRAFVEKYQVYSPSVCRGYENKQEIAEN